MPFVFVLLAQGASAQETAPLRQSISAKKDAKRSQPDAAYWVLPGGGQIGCDYQMGACSWVCYKF